MKSNHLTLKSILCLQLLVGPILGRAAFETQNNETANEVRNTYVHEAYAITAGHESMESAAAAMLDTVNPKQSKFEKTYAAFFSKYTLNKEQRELIRSILENDQEPVVGQVRQKERNRETQRALQAERKLRFEKALRGPLGDKAFDALLYYLDTRILRELADDIAVEISESGSSLSVDQIDLFVQIFSKHNLQYAPVMARATKPSLNKTILRSFIEKENDILGDIEKTVTNQQMGVIRQFWFGFTQGQPTREQIMFEDTYKDFFLRYPMSKDEQELIRIALKNEAQFLRSIRKSNARGLNKGFHEERKRRFREELGSHLGDKAIDAFVYYRETVRERKLANNIVGLIKHEGSEFDDEKTDLLVDIFKRNKMGYVRIGSDSEFTIRTSKASKNNVMMEAELILNKQQADIMKKYLAAHTNAPSEKNNQSFASSHAELEE